MIERLFGKPADAVLYVGDHVFADVSITKATLRWRTALVVQELEGEVLGLSGARPVRAKLQELLTEQYRLHDVINYLRADLRRSLLARTNPPPKPSPVSFTTPNLNPSHSCCLRSLPPPLSLRVLRSQVRGLARTHV